MINLFVYNKMTSNAAKTACIMLFEQSVIMVDLRSDKLDFVNLQKVAFTVFAFSIIYKFYSYNCMKIIVRVRLDNPKFKLIGPNDLLKMKPKDKYNQLIDLTDFEFKVNPDPCKDYPTGLLLIIIVSSSPINTGKRMVIRETWGQNTDSTKVVFLLGDPVHFNLTKEIAEESATYGDIVQGNFVDAYRNMTYKHVMGLKWVAHHCPTARYILKTDDDIVVNIRDMQHFLTRELSPWGASNLIACNVRYDAGVFRSESKWIVTVDEYPYDCYPTYCLGWSILYSQDVVIRLLNKAHKTSYFWIDDVYVTGLLAERAGVPRTSLSDVNRDYHPYLYSSPDLGSEEMEEAWQNIPKEYFAMHIMNRK